MMHEKGRKLIKEAMKRKTLVGLDTNCDYLPCHDNLEDCTFCFCPFYPCYEEDTGGFEKISEKSGKQVWACSSCMFAHMSINAQKILEGLIAFNKDFDQITHKELLDLRKKILDESKRSD